MDTNGIQAIGSYTGQHIHINAGTKDVTMLVACIIASDLSPASLLYHPRGRLRGLSGRVRRAEGRPL